MSHLRIVLGYETAHRRSEPVILGTSLNSRDALQAVVDASDPKYQRFELGVFQFSRKMRRSLTPPPEAAETPVAGAPGGDSATASGPDDQQNTTRAEKASLPAAPEQPAAGPSSLPVRKKAGGAPDVSF